MKEIFVTLNGQSGVLRPGAAIQPRATYVLPHHSGFPWAGKNEGMPILFVAAGHISAGVFRQHTGTHFSLS